MTEGKIYRTSETDEYAFREGCSILEMLNDGESPDASVARATVAPHSATRWHSLEGVRERYVIVSGGGRVELGGGIREQVSAGDCVDIPAGVAQRIINTADVPLVFLCICTPRFVEDCYRDLES